ncbi:hypothetical protein MMC25_007501 [Agyrium rufum]|nr:hypothetical protein [Agyrium rufum]
MAQQFATIPSTPRVISPSPTPGDLNDPSSIRDGYFAPVTRSVAKRINSSSRIPEEPSSGKDSDSDLEKRARARSRSPKTLAARRRRLSGLNSKTDPIPPIPEKIAQNGVPQQNGKLLSPPSTGTSYWRDFSRSPSPLGLIPIHRHWRSFVHRHEIPRKALHVSIGFVTLDLYARGIQPATIAPYLFYALVPIASMDVLRHRFPAINRFYVRCLGALMRESEYDKYNGVIWYLLGTWIAMRWFPKDIGVMSILLLSWCDTAASTIGRLYGRYTPRVRKGKSLAGSVAAAVVGVVTAGLFYGVFVPKHWGVEDSFEFRGALALPRIEIPNTKTIIVKGGEFATGWLAIGVMSIWSGLAASASELVDLWGMDDNLTIPVLSGLGLWGFLKVFG